MGKSISVHFGETVLLFAQREGEGHITYLDEEGKPTQHAVWFELLKLFAHHKIGPGLLKAIARLAE